jgi:hypothetical protein
MTNASQSDGPGKDFPHLVEIRNPSDNLKNDLALWEKANESSEWKPGAPSDARHSWTSRTQAGSSTATTRQYLFKSASDASLFNREYGESQSSEPWAKS